MNKSLQKILAYFRALIPSWGFFDDPGAAPLAQVRSGESHSRLGAWRDALPPLPRRPWNLFFNPAGNERLFTLSMMERLIVECQEHISQPDAFTHSISYQMCSQIIQEQLFKSEMPPFCFQFRIMAYLDSDSIEKSAKTKTSALAEVETKQEAFVSAVQSVEGAK